MLEQSVFTETIREVSEIIRTSAEPLSKEEILSYFKEMELNEQQENMVLEFLLTPHDTDEPEEEPDETESDETGSDETEPGETAESCVPESKLFQMYMEEVKNLPVYSEKKLEELYGRLLAGEESVIRAISDSWMIRVLEIVKRLAVSTDGFEDLVQEGNMALFLKLTELCGNGGKPDVEDELQRAVEEAVKTFVVELEGEDEDEKSVVGKVALVNEARRYLTDENAKAPSLKELSDYTQMTEDELSDILLLIQKAEETGKQQ